MAPIVKTQRLRDQIDSGSWWLQLVLHIFLETTA
jgi:hypothetical protein